MEGKGSPDRDGVEVAVVTSVAATNAFHLIICEILDVGVYCNSIVQLIAASAIKDERTLQYFVIAIDTTRSACAAVRLDPRIVK